MRGHVDHGAHTSRWVHNRRDEQLQKFPIDRASFPKNMKNGEMEMVGAGNGMEIGKS
jgi:hypothetical protein